jgi:Flp pilus assembly pilin Flp
MRDLTERFGDDNSGETSLEYGLIAAGIAVGLTMAMVSLGAQLKSNLAQISSRASPASSTALGRPASPTDRP